MVELIPMTEKEAIGIQISYSVDTTPFGNIYIASTDKGICAVGYYSPLLDDIPGLIKGYYPNANVAEDRQPMHIKAMEMITGKISANHPPLTLHLPATPFRLNVFRQLLRIPRGKTITYGALAEKIGCKGASRAVGSAVGANPVAMLIPCHRVVRYDGSTGQYRWGSQRKAIILAWEAHTQINE